MIDRIYCVANSIIHFLWENYIQCLYKPTSKQFIFIRNRIHQYIPLMKSITGESLTSNHINFLLNRKQREIVNVCRNSINKRNYLHIKTKKCSASIILYLVIRYYTTLSMLTVFPSKCVVIYSHPTAKNIYSFVLLHRVF